MTSTGSNILNLLISRLDKRILEKKKKEINKYFKVKSFARFFVCAQNDVLARSGLRCV